MNSPSVPKNSPNINPKIMAASELAINILPRLCNNSRFFQRHLSQREDRSRMAPYPISPRIRPKKTGKKTANSGVGSKVPYFGRDKNRVSTSKGLMNPGLFRTTGVSPLAQSIGFLFHSLYKPFPH